MGGQAEESSHHPVVGLALFAFCTVVTTPAALGTPMDLPEPGPAAFAEASPELPDLSECRAEGSSPKEQAAVVGLGDDKVTIDDVPDSTDFLEQAPDFSEYVAEGSCPYEQVVVAGLRDSRDNVPDVLDFPNSLASILEELYDFSEHVADGDCPQDEAIEAQLGDSEDTTLTTNVPSLTAEVLNELPDLSE